MLPGNQPCTWYVLCTKKFLGNQSWFQFSKDVFSAASQTIWYIDVHCIIKTTISKYHISFPDFDWCRCEKDPPIISMSRTMRVSGYGSKSVCRQTSSSVSLLCSTRSTTSDSDKPSRLPYSWWKNRDRVCWLDLIFGFLTLSFKYHLLLSIVKRCQMCMRNYVC